MTAPSAQGSEAASLGIDRGRRCAYCGRCIPFAYAVIDTGARHSLGSDGTPEYFEHISSRNPARRIGTRDDIADAVLFTMTHTFLTGVTLKVDGGEPLT